MKYGYFDDDNWEYVVTDPRTPVTWINYIGTLKFGGFVNQTGGMLLCKGDPAENRITKYIPQLPASDLKGSTLYLRLHTEDGYKVFSPFVVPTLDEYESYECRVGLGYTKIVSQFYGVETAVTFFIPTADQIAIQDITITNKTGKAITIDAIPVIEYTHPDALKQFTNADWIPQTMTSEVVEEENGRKLLLQFPFMTRDFKVNVLSSSEPIFSFETDRRIFLGRNEFGTWAAPMALQAPELSNREAIRGDNIGALMLHLGTLPVDGAKRFQVLLGQYNSAETAKPIIAKYRQVEVVDAALASRAAFWQEFLTGMQVETPDVNMNRMLNIYNPRQTYITKNWSRYLSLYQLGLGARGIGFRDSSQDVMGVLTFAPEEGLDLIRQLLHTQLRNGSAMHQFNPLSMVATNGEAGEDDRPDFYSDDHLWIVLAVAAYLKETGNFDVLAEVIPFYEKDKAGQPLESGTIWEHLCRAIEFTNETVGAHGLPLAGFADWNDTVNLLQGAESLMTANLYGKALLEMIEMAGVKGETAVSTGTRQAVSQKFSEYHATMKARVNEHAWDGDWYVRYFDYDGTPVGSEQNAEGKIFTNGQSWPVISGFATPERAQTALDSVYKLLNTANGIKLSTPGYDGYDPEKGGVTTYRPGAKENGGIFLHANPWVMIAETLMGNGNRAYEYYNQLNPAAKNDHIDEYECEPYVYPQNILGDEHPQFGLARNSWLTGTASWMYQAGSQYILGIQPTFAGLRLAPCIPAEWDGFKVSRKYRGSRYNIEVNNPDHVCQGIKSVFMDGKAVPGNILPLFDDTMDHEVVVTMG